MTLAHFLVGSFHLEYALMGVAIGGLGVWMWRTGADKRGGILMTTIGIVLLVAAFAIS